MNKIEIGTKCIIAHYDFLEDKNEQFAKVSEIEKVTPKRFYTINDQVFNRETLRDIAKPDHISWNHKTEKLFFFDSEALLQKRLELVKKRNFITNFVYTSHIDFNKLSDSEIESLYDILKKSCKKK